MKKKEIINYLKQNKEVFDECEKITSEFPSEEISARFNKKYKIKRGKQILSYPACAVVMIGIFLVFTFPGQALSKSIGYTIARIFGGEIIIEHVVEPENNTNISLPKGKYTYSSIHSAAESMDTKLLYIDSDDVDSVEVDVTVEPTLTAVESTYFMKNGFEVKSIQIFFGNQEVLNYKTITDENEVYEMRLSNGEKMYISENIDGNYGVAVWKDISFVVSSENMNTDLFNNTIFRLRETK